jgi:phosphoesterase RecJ-like protein
MSVFFSEKEGLVKMSFRSRNNFSVKELASKHFEGGGHTNAAGGKSKLSLQETIEKFVRILPEYKEELNSGE